MNTLREYVFIYKNSSPNYAFLALGTCYFISNFPPISTHFPSFLLRSASI